MTSMHCWKANGFVLLTFLFLGGNRIVLGLDCNGNGIEDADDLAGTSADCQLRPAGLPLRAG